MDVEELRRKGYYACLYCRRFHICEPFLVHLSFEQRCLVAKNCKRWEGDC